MLLLLTKIVAAGTLFTCTPVRVWDGDGPVWCAEGPRLRLSGIAAREMDGSCRTGQPCPEASATLARDTLVRILGTPVGRSSEGHVLVRARPLRCVSVGSGRGSRTAAWCVTSTGVDVSCAMVRSGTALRWPRYWGAHRCR
jgi:endonuclease YncB( thermonuclease family)